MSRGARICIVTSNHVASNPRVVKEADTLQAAGHQVTVVASDHYPPARELDQTVLRGAAWDCIRIGPVSGRLSATAAKLSRRACLALARSGLGGLGIAVRAADERHASFLRAAVGTGADLYIGHTIPGLAAAALAARETGRLLAFDAEDWHPGEQAECERPAGLTRAIRTIENACVPLCAHVTAASPLIGTRYASLSRTPPVTLLNVFPTSEGPVEPLDSPSVPRAVYWFSQTIGRGRGLEAVVRAVALLPKGWSLHLRGTPARGYREELDALARGLGVPDRIVWLPPAPPEQMPRLAAPYAVGLSVEQVAPENRAICLTNKTFTYLLAGTPVVLSDTPAHRLLLPDLAAAAALASLEDPRSVADAILGLATPEARAHAWRIGRERYNWDREAGTLLKTVEATLHGTGR